MTLLTAPRGTRLVALVSFVGAFLYYKYDATMARAQYWDGTVGQGWFGNGERGRQGEHLSGQLDQNEVEMVGQKDANETQVIEQTGRNEQQGEERGDDIEKLHVEQMDKSAQQLVGQLSNENAGQGSKNGNGDQLVKQWDEKEETLKQWNKRGEKGNIVNKNRKHENQSSDVNIVNAELEDEYYDTIKEWNLDEQHEHSETLEQSKVNSNNNNNEVQKDTIETQEGRILQTTKQAQPFKPKTPPSQAAEIEQEQEASINSATENENTPLALAQLALDNNDIPTNDWEEDEEENVKPIKTRWMSTGVEEEDNAKPVQTGGMSTGVVEPVRRHGTYRTTGTTITGPPLPVLRPSNGSALAQLDLSGYSKKLQKFLKSRLRVFQRRAKHVSKVCRKRSQLQQSAALHLVWDVNRSPPVIYCPMYKVGSTSWMINFLRLAHFNEDNPELLNLSPTKRKKMQFSTRYGANQSKAFKIYPAPNKAQTREKVLKESLRMIVVRHPFSRIISAYRDKMTKMNPRPVEHQFRSLQRHIISRYRKNNRDSTSPFPTFPEFVQYILDSTQTLHTREDWMANVKCWLPYWVMCNVCGVDYNLILQLETSEADTKFLVNVANMEELKELGEDEWRHLRNGTSSNDLMIQYFSQLTRWQVRQLRLRYLLDFELFGYKLDPELLSSAGE